MSDIQNEIGRPEEKKTQGKNDSIERDRGGEIILIDGEPPCPDSHENIIICTFCPGEPRYCSLCICAHMKKKHNGGLVHIKDKVRMSFTNSLNRL